jgi:hypothetical protein
MKTLYNILRAAISLVLIAASLCLPASVPGKLKALYPSNPASSDAPKAMPAQQVETFLKLGFELNPGVDTADLFQYGRQVFEDKPYTELYRLLGENLSNKPEIPVTNKCWSFHMAGVKEQGGYAGILKNLQRITGDELVFENLQEKIDPEKETDEITFTMKGGTFTWKLRAADEFFDTDLFNEVVGLTDQFKTKRRFTFYDTGGPEVVIGYETRDGLTAIRKATGLRITWLN